MVNIDYENLDSNEAKIELRLLHNLLATIGSGKSLIHSAVVTKKLDINQAYMLIAEQEKNLSLVMGALTHNEKTRKELIDFLKEKEEREHPYSIEEILIVSEDILTSELGDLHSKDKRDEYIKKAEQLIEDMGKQFPEE